MRTALLASQDTTAMLGEIMRPIQWPRAASLLISASCVLMACGLQTGETGNRQGEVAANDTGVLWQSNSVERIGECEQDQALQLRRVERQAATLRFDLGMTPSRGVPARPRYPIETRIFADGHETQLRIADTSVDATGAASSTLEIATDTLPQGSLIIEFRAAGRAARATFDHHDGKLVWLPDGLRKGVRHVQLDAMEAPVVAVPIYATEAANDFGGAL